MKTKKRLFALLSAAVMSISLSGVSAGADYEPYYAGYSFEDAFQDYLEQNGLHHYEGLGVLKDVFRGEVYYSDQALELHILQPPYAEIIMRTDISAEESAAKLWDILDTYFEGEETEKRYDALTGTTNYIAVGKKYFQYSAGKQPYGLIFNQDFTTSFSDGIIAKLMEEELITKYQAWDFSISDWHVFTDGCLYYCSTDEDAVRAYLEAHHPSYQIYHRDGDTYGFFVAPEGVTDWSSTNSASPNVKFTKEEQLMLWEEIYRDLNVFVDLNSYVWSVGSPGEHASGYTAALIRGDLDIDGAVDVTDAVKMLHLLNEDTGLTITEAGISNADFNRDNELTLDDFRALMRYLAGY